VKTVYRVVKNSNFVVMDKTFLNDNRLSWKAKGIMAYMLSKPDNWTFYIDELIKHSTDGKASFRAGFKELRDNGYVKRYPVRKNNKIDRWETVVLENPLLTDFQEVENQEVEKQEVGNRTLLNNDLTKNDSTKNEHIVEIVNYLNRVADKNYRHFTRKTRNLIKARFNEGFTVDDFKKVIDTKNDEWKNNNKMKKFIRPETLFGTKFESYLNQDTPVKNTNDIDWDDL